MTALLLFINFIYVRVRWFMLFTFFTYIIGIFRRLVLHYWFKIWTAYIFVNWFARNSIRTKTFLHVRIWQLSFNWLRSLFTCASLLFSFFFRSYRPKLVYPIFKRERRISFINILINFLTIVFCGKSDIIINLGNNRLSRNNQWFILKLMK